MPRETVQDATSAYTVKVGWRADQDVQVGVEQPAGYSLLSQLYGDDATLTSIGNAVLDITGWRADMAAQGAVVEPWEPAELGRRVLDAIEGSALSHTGLWATLDRAGINRLVRLLRRARDAAYGRDE